MPPAAEEAAAANTPPACPRNARFSFCAVEPVRASICWLGCGDGAYEIAAGLGLDV